jgi:hypothetical protein
LDVRDSNQTIFLSIIIKMKTDQEMHESEDEVLAEFDICIAGSLTEHLLLLQYPTRPSFRPYGDQGVIAAAEIAMVSKQMPIDKDAMQDSLQPKII